MTVYLNDITGFADAITSLYISKRSWSREMEARIRAVCAGVLDARGAVKTGLEGERQKDAEQFNDWLNKLVKVGWKHITLLRFIDFSVTVEGLHRAGQDDWDSHAKRFGNRILRSSTRLAKFDYEMSAWYEGKIIPTDLALAQIGVSLPESIEKDGETYVKGVNGYIRQDLADNNDVKRGLYMLSIPSNFIFKVDLCEWSHVYKMRNKDSSANPEVKACCESIAEQIEALHPALNRALFMKVLN